MQYYMQIEYYIQYTILHAYIILYTQCHGARLSKFQYIHNTMYIHNSIQTATARAFQRAPLKNLRPASGLGFKVTGLGSEEFETGKHGGGIGDQQIVAHVSVQHPEPERPQCRQEWQDLLCTFQRVRGRVGVHESEHRHHK